MSAFDLCPVCELPRFAHSWRIYRKRTSGLEFREPFPESPRWSWRTVLRLSHSVSLPGPV